MDGLGSVPSIPTLLKEMSKEIELAEKEKSELNIMEAYLPKQFSEEEISELIKNIISEISAKNISDIGKVMAIVMKKGGGKVDGGIANRIAKELLQ